VQNDNVIEQSVYNHVNMQPDTRSTQPGHTSVGRRNEYQPKGGDTQRQGGNRGHGRVLLTVASSAHVYD